MTAAFEEANATKESISKFVNLEEDDNKKHDHLFCIEYHQRKTYLINLQEMRKIPVSKRIDVRRWDFLRTLKPPEHLNVENGKIHHIELLKVGSPDYDFVA